MHYSLFDEPDYWFATLDKPFKDEMDEVDDWFDKLDEPLKDEEIKSDLKEMKDHKLKFTENEINDKVQENENSPKKYELTFNLEKPFAVMLKINLMLLLLSIALPSLLKHFIGDSGALLVKGLLVIMMCINLLVNSKRELKQWEETKSNINDLKDKMENNNNNNNNDQDQKQVPSTKKNYIGIKSIINELNELKHSLKTFDNEPDEIKKASKIIDQCLALLDRIKSLQYAFKIILQRSEEYSLDEIISTLKQAEDNIGRNIFNITNRLILELNIKGFDTTQINEYLQNNEDIVDGSTLLVKEALEYIERKENLDDNIIGIETLTTTIQDLKKQLK